MNLFCESSFKIGLIGSTYMLGIVLGSITLTRMGDTKGRKGAFIIGMFIQAGFTLGFLFIKDIEYVYVMVFVIGFAITGK